MLYSFELICPGRQDAERWTYECLDLESML